MYHETDIFWYFTKNISHERTFLFFEISFRFRKYFKSFSRTRRKLNKNIFQLRKMPLRKYTFSTKHNISWEKKINDGKQTNISLSRGRAKCQKMSHKIICFSFTENVSHERRFLFFKISFNLTHFLKSYSTTRKNPTKNGQVA